MPINFEPVDMSDDDDQTEVRNTRNTERDEDQQEVDKLTEPLVKSWRDAGQPKQEASPWRKLVVAKTDVSAVKSMIRRACTLYKTVPLYWKDVTRPDGRVSIKYTVTTPPPRKDKNAPAGNATAAPQPAPAAAGKPGPRK
jgi:hypothetical protein